MISCASDWISLNGFLVLTPRSARLSRAFWMVPAMARSLSDVRRRLTNSDKDRNGPRRRISLTISSASASICSSVRATYPENSEAFGFRGLDRVEPESVDWSPAMVVLGYG